MGRALAINELDRAAVGGGVELEVHGPNSIPPRGRVVDHLARPESLAARDVNREAR